ncbi:MAG: trigger factor [Elusimicrobiota bacterium]
MAIWSPTVKTKAKKLKTEGSKHTYEVEVPAARVQETIHNVFLRIQLQARISGFRQGKAPLEFVKRQYGDRARAEAVDDLIKRVIPETLKDLDVRPVAMPAVANVRMDRESPLKFDLHVEVAPKFEPKGYKGIAVTHKEYAVTDKDIETRLTQLQEGNARLEISKADSVAKGHYIIVDFVLSRDGKPLENGEGKQELVEISSDQTIEGLTQGLIGSKRRETRELEVKIDDKPTQCRITTQEIKEKVLPQIDDEFAKDMGFDSLKTLKEKLGEVVKNEYEQKSESELRQQIEKALLDANAFDVPPSLAEQQLDFMMERLTARLAGPDSGLPEKEAGQLREKLRPAAVNEVRMQFITSEIARREKIEATGEDLKEDLERHLAQSESDDQKKQTRELFEKRADDIRAAIRDRKVFQLIREAAKITAVKA